MGGALELAISWSVNPDSIGTLKKRALPTAFVGKRCNMGTSPGTGKNSFRAATVGTIDLMGWKRRDEVELNSRQSFA